MRPTDAGFSRMVSAASRPDSSQSGPRAEAMTARLELLWELANEQRSKRMNETTAECLLPEGSPVLTRSHRDRQCSRRVVGRRCTRHRNSRRTMNTISVYPQNCSGHENEKAGPLSPGGPALALLSSIRRKFCLPVARTEVRGMRWRPRNCHLGS